MRIMKIFDRWNVFGVAAAALCTCIGGFLLPPPLRQDPGSYHFAVFLVTLLVALWSIPVTVWSARTHLRPWLGIAVVLFALSISGYFFYNHLLSEWTFFYPPGTPTAQREIAGATLSDDARKLQARLKSLEQDYGPARLVYLAGGEFSAIWPNTAERDGREQKLEWTYFSLWLVFASVVVGTVQATFCVTQTDGEGSADQSAQTRDKDPATAATSSTAVERGA